MRRYGPLLSLLALFGIHLAVRVRCASEVFGSSETEPLYAGSDSFYHAHRIHLNFEAFPDFVHFDRFMDFPRGAISQWSLGFDWVIAGVLRLFTSRWETALWWLPWTSVLVSLVALASFLWVALGWLPRWAALAATLALSLNLAFVRVSTPAELDHHVVECLCVIWLLALPRVTSLARQGRFSPAIALGIGLAWTVWTSTLLAFLVAGFLGLWLVANQLGRGRAPRPHFAIALLVTLSLCALMEAHARADYFALPTLSVLHVVMVAAPIVALAATQWLSPARLWAAIGASTAVLAVLLWDHIAWIVAFVDGGDPIIGNINEARPLFQDLRGFTTLAAHAFFGPALLLVPVAVVVVLRRALRDRDADTSDLIVVVLFTSALMLASLLQKRFAHLAVPTFVLLLSIWGARLPRPTWALAALIALLLEPTYTFFEETRFVVPDNAKTYVRMAHSIRDAARGRPERGVSAPPNFGSAINYAAHLPSVTNGFFYPKYLKHDLALRELESTEAMVAYMRREGLGYLVALDDARYRTMLLRMFGRRDEAQLAEVWERSPCAGPLLRYSYDRLACDQASTPEFELLERLHVSNDPVRLWRRITVYRLREPHE